MSNSRGPKSASAVTGNASISTHSNNNSSSGGGGSGSSRKFKKFRDDTAGGGCYSEEYHNLLGKSAWIHVTSIDNRQLTEGDIAIIFSQFGNVRDVRFIRHRKTGAFLGSAFIEFTDYRSGILASDNMNSSSASPVRLTPVCTRGIHVERCAASEVMNPPQEGEQTYGDWVDQNILSGGVVPPHNA